MAGDSNIGAWTETALVEIAPRDGTAMAFHALTETIDIDEGDKDVEYTPLLNGGNVTKYTPKAPTEVTLEAYALEAGNSSATGTGFFDLLFGTTDATQPLVLPVTVARTKYRMAILWTNLSSVTTASGQVAAANTQALRWVGSYGYITSVKPSFTDGILKFTVKFKVAPFDQAGSAQIKVESVNSTGTVTLTALATFSGTYTAW